MEIMGTLRGGANGLPMSGSRGFKPTRCQATLLLAVLF
jgi:hypothetical protein